MRRVPKILLTAACGLLAAPLIVASQALPADAATGKLLVTTIARDGHSVTSPITVVKVSPIDSPLPTWDHSGHTLSLPDGPYAVLSAIQDSASGTLAATVVTVSGTGTTKVTLDARRGHLIKATLNGKALTGYIDARVCADSGFGQSELSGIPGSVYVVPSTVKALSFAYLAQGQGATVTGLTSSGIPGSPGGAWTSAQLAKVSLTVRSGETAGDTTRSVLQPESPNGPNDCQWDLWGPVKQAAAPYSYTELVSAGYWNMRTDDTSAASGAAFGGYGLTRHVLAGHAYSFTYYPAAWGVGGPSTKVHLPIVGRKAISVIAPSITDPGGNGDIDFSSLSALALALGGHQIATGKVSDGGQVEVFTAGIKSAGWYTLTDDVTRDYSRYPGFTPPAGILSPRVALSWRFYATPGQAEIAPSFWTSFIPAGLNAMNQGKPRAATAIRVVPSRPSSDPNAPVVTDTVTKLQVYVSTDDGKTWHSSPAVHTASGWTATVNNPASGFVSLRATVTGSHGDTSTETIYRAYAIS
jgi:hypothetical protein